MCAGAREGISPSACEEMLKTDVLTFIRKVGDLFPRVSFPAKIGAETKNGLCKHHGINALKR